MNRVFVLIVLSLFFDNSWACIISPWHKVAISYQQYLERADVVFLGKLEKEKRIGEYYQEGEFTVIKSYKGNAGFGGKLIVINHYNSSCSRIFHPEGAAFYVFANRNDEGELFIEGYATFVPMSVAVEVNMGLK